MHVWGYIFVGIAVVILNACSSDSGDSVNPQTSIQSARVRLKMSADYGSKTLTRMLAVTCSDVSEDGPETDAGLDCDGDQGVVRFSTPKQFGLAFTKVFLTSNENDTLWLVSPVDSLKQATYIDLTQPVLLDGDTSDLIHYQTIHATLYYYQLRMELNHPDEMVDLRIYMSDDDFAQEGNLGHHQGDITLLNSDGTEAGWAPGGVPWVVAAAEATRSDEAHTGAGGVDSETGHSRGFYGDAYLWNAAPFMQGSTQDLFHFTASIDLNLPQMAANAVAENDSTNVLEATLVMNFDLEDTWYFEDFDDNQVFSPGGANLEAADEGATWSPLMPTPVFRLELAD